MSEKALREKRAVVFTEKPPFPHNMMLELTNACNHKCVFCAYRDMTRAKTFMDETFAKRILKEAYEGGTREVGFYLIGEPFLYEKLAEIVKYSKDIGFEYVYITTNGGVATPEKMSKVLAAGLDSIKFSVNAATVSSYKEVHGRDDYETVRENIRFARKYIDEHKLDVGLFISFVECNFNKNDIDNLRDDFEKVVDKIYICPCGNQGGRMGKLLRDKIVDVLKPAAKPCAMVFNRLHITAEGYLDACCTDTNGELRMADLHKMSLKDAWHSSNMVELRRQHLGKIKENVLCYNCVHNTDYAVSKDVFKI